MAGLCRLGDAGWCMYAVSMRTRARVRGDLPRDGLGSPRDRRGCQVRGPWVDGPADARREDRAGRRSAWNLERIPEVETVGHGGCGEDECGRDDGTSGLYSKGDAR